jgi:hypothetical protein
MARSVHDRLYALTDGSVSKLSLQHGMGFAVTGIDRDAAELDIQCHEPADPLRMRSPSSSDLPSNR